MEPRRFEGKVLINEDTFHESATSHLQTTTIVVLRLFLTTFAFLNFSHIVFFYFYLFSFANQDEGSEYGTRLCSGTRN